MKTGLGNLGSIEGFHAQRCSHYWTVLTWFAYKISARNLYACSSGFGISRGSSKIRSSTSASSAFGSRTSTKGFVPCNNWACKKETFTFGGSASPSI